jgi:hypothetical protein
VPDFPVSTPPNRHTVLVTPHRGSWLLWCVCGLDEVHETFDAAYKARGSHIAHTPLLVASGFSEHPVEE